MRKRQNGFAHIEIIIIVVIVIGAAGFIAWRMLGTNQNSATQAPQTEGTPIAEEASTPPPQLIWQQAENGWRSAQTPPPAPTSQ